MQKPISLAANAVLTSLFLIPALLIPATGIAQIRHERQQQTPLVVTARKWEELASEIPLSLSTIGSDTLRDGAYLNIRDAARFVPNMVMTEFSARRLSFPYIRGVGSGQGDPAVATFIDGVPQLEISSTNVPLIGLDRVEVLRGPAGALYGRNTLGGAIHLVTREPTSETELDGRVTFGNFGLNEYQFYGAMPLNKEWAASFAGVYSRRDGYTTNQQTGLRVDSRDGWYGRGQLLWRPENNSEVRLSLFHERARDGGFVLSDIAGLRTNPRSINYDYEGAVERDQRGGALTWKCGCGGIDFTSISSIQNWEIAERTDFDFSSFDFVRRMTDAKQTYYYQELRFGSPQGRDVKLGDGAELRWLFGVSGFRSDSKQQEINEYRPDSVALSLTPGMDRARGTFDGSAVGVYGQATVVLGRYFELSGALRYDYERRDADINRDFSGFPTSARDVGDGFDEFLPRVSVAYRRDGAIGYVSAARGFKAGGFNLTAPASSTSFGPETSWTYEAGVRSELFGSGVTGGVTAFFIDWDDMQLSQFDPSTGGFVGNAGESWSRGLEFELNGRPTENLQVFGSFGVLSTQFRSFRDQFGTDVSGRDLPFAPDHTLSGGLQYSGQLNETVSWFARAEYVYVGKFYYDAGNRDGEQYDVANFRLGIGNQSWRLEGFLNNAFDEEYIPIAFQANPANPSAFVGENAAPRTWGISLSATF
ncbi:MAG: TonB-dependent receptor [Planctomycetes bacterium]|nr:TonB-dependent receptor [Planctomycetota bacterium]